MWNRLNTSMMFCQMMFGFSFYGVMVILTRFFMQELNYDEADTMMVVGAFSSIGPLFAIAGGFIADKFLGAYRSLLIAFVTFALGYVLLVLGASAINIPMSLTGIALASYARGLMSPTYPSIYKRTFKDPQDFENAYPINYSVNNLGSLIGKYIFPLVVLAVGFYSAFSISVVLACLAVFTLLARRKSLLAVCAEHDKAPVSMGNWLFFIVLSCAMVGLVFFMFSNMDIGKNIVYVIGLMAILYFIFLMVKSDKATALRMSTILIIMFLTTCFFLYYGQMMTSMTMVAINTMRGDLFNIVPIAPEASMAMNPFWCILSGPFIAVVFMKLEKRGINFSTATKMGFAFICTAISFGILTFAVKHIAPNMVIRPEIFFVVHAFQALSEVIFGSLAVAFIIKVAPKTIENFSVSLYSVAMALSGILGAVFSTSIALDKGQALTATFVHDTYGHYFELLTELAVVMVAVAFVSSFIIKKILQKADKYDNGDSNPEPQLQEAHV
ncbi:MAG: peptide MFS transporter [Vibrio sp.]